MKKKIVWFFLFFICLIAVFILLLYGQRALGAEYKEMQIINNWLLSSPTGAVEAVLERDGDYEIVGREISVQENIGPNKFKRHYALIVFVRPNKDKKFYNTLSFRFFEIHNISSRNYLISNWFFFDANIDGLVDIFEVYKIICDYSGKKKKIIILNNTGKESAKDQLKETAEYYFNKEIEFWLAYIEGRI